jgi:hypothetical protein
MQIWLGKQVLGQTDKVEKEVTGSAGGPVQLIITDAESAA